MKRSSAGPRSSSGAYGPQWVFGHSLVETMHEAPEGLLAADLLVEGLLLKRAAPNLFHLTIVSDRVTEDARLRTSGPSGPAARRARDPPRGPSRSTVEV